MWRIFGGSIDFPIVLLHAVHAGARFEHCNYNEIPFEY